MWERSGTPCRHVTDQIGQAGVDHRRNPVAKRIPRASRQGIPAPTGMSTLRKLIAIFPGALPVSRKHRTLLEIPDHNPEPRKVQRANWTSSNGREAISQLPEPPPGKDHRHNAQRVPRPRAGSSSLSLTIRMSTTIISINMRTSTPSRLGITTPGMAKWSPLRRQLDRLAASNPSGARHHARHDHPLALATMKTTMMSSTPTTHT